MSTKLDAALALAKRGFSVFPLRAYDPNVPLPDKAAKKPGIDEWPIAATTDEARIRNWWRYRPHANIGVYTGSLLVLDVDPGKGGTDSMAMLRMVYGDLPRTYSVVTQSGGVHLYFSLPPHTHVSCSQGEIADGLDVRGDGGYVVGPGSTVAERKYTHVPPSGETLTPAPDWLISLCKQAKPTKASTVERLIEETPRAVAAADQWLEQHAPRPGEGQRNRAGFVVAAKLLNFGLAEDTLRDRLLRWNERHCSPPMDAEEVLTIAASAARGTQRPVGCDSPDYCPFDAIDDAGEPPLIVTPVESVPAKPDKFRSIPAAEGAKLALTKRGRFLIKGLLDCGGMSVLYGESGGGKTFVAEDLAYHVGKGVPWHGQRVRKGAVVYLAAEGGQGIYARLAALREHYGSLDDVWLHLIAVPADFIHGPADVQGMLAEIKRVELAHGQKVELIVVDTLSRAMAGGDENSSVDMGAMVKALDYLRQAANAHVMTVHHTGKDKAKGARGHSLLRAATDTEIEIDNKILSVTKQRDMDSTLQVGFRLKPIQIGVDEDGDPITSCFVELRDLSETLAEPQPLTGECAQFAAGLRKWLIEEYDTKTPVPDKLPFKTATAIEVWANFTPQNARVHREKPRAFSAIVTRLLQELHENAHARKSSKGKWILDNAQNAQNAHLGPDPECTDAHGASSPCIPCVTAGQA